MRTTVPSKLPLHQLLWCSATVLRQVLQGQSANQALLALAPAEKAGTQAISFYALRHLHSAQALAQLLLKKPPPAQVQAILWVALALLSASQRPAVAAVPQYQPFVVVNQAVQALATRRKTAPFKGLINACLRRYLREADALYAQACQCDSARYGYPDWWRHIVQQAYPEQWQAILAADHSPGPLCLRVNRQRTQRDRLLAQWQHANICAYPVGEDALMLQQAMPVEQIPGFDQGLVAVQDAAAQLAASLLPLRPGMRVLDACAAPGGKTAHAIERWSAPGAAPALQWVAADIDAQRLSRVHDNLQHLGLYDIAQIELVQVDVSQPWDVAPFDAILADVPCTGSGVVRRHPDIKWLRQADDLPRTVALQQQIIQRLWSLLKPGGYFLYATCSIFPQENEAQAQYILTHCPGAKRLPAPGQLLPIGQQSPWMATPETLNLPPGVALHDGFFYALFCKQATEETLC